MKLTNWIIKKVKKRRLKKQQVENFDKQIKEFQAIVTERIRRNKETIEIIDELIELLKK